MSIEGSHLLSNENETIVSKVGAGEKWMDLIVYTIKHGYHGLESLAGIPGSVGAATIQNIGAYGVELSDVFYECQVFDIENQCLVSIDEDFCRFKTMNNHSNVKHFTIPADKNACFHLLFATVGFKRIVHFFDGFAGNFNDDIIRILQWIDEYHIANFYFHLNQSLIILPNQTRLTDLSSASVSRASIDIAGMILLRSGHVRVRELGGYQFTRRLIDLHRS